MRRWLWVVALALGLAACAPAVEISESTATPGGVSVSTTVPGTLDVNVTPDGRGDKDVAVAFARSGGIDGAQRKRTIFSDGTIMLAESPDFSALEVGRVTAAQVSGLLAGLDGLGFFQFQDRYENDQCADCYQYVVSVTSGGVTKTVTTVDSAQDAPAELGQALALIQAILPTAT